MSTFEVDKETRSMATFIKKITTLDLSGGQPTKAKEPTKEEQMKMLIDQVRKLLIVE